MLPELTDLITLDSPCPASSGIRALPWLMLVKATVPKHFSAFSPIASCPIGVVTQLVAACKEASARSVYGGFSCGISISGWLTISDLRARSGTTQTQHPRKRCLGIQQLAVRIAKVLRACDTKDYRATTLAEMWCIKRQQVLTAG